MDDNNNVVVFEDKTDTEPRTEQAKNEQGCIPLM